MLTSNAFNSTPVDLFAARSTSALALPSWPNSRLIITFDSRLRPGSLDQVWPMQFYPTSAQGVRMNRPTGWVFVYLAVQCNLWLLNRLRGAERILCTTGRWFITFPSLTLSPPPFSLTFGWPTLYSVGVRFQPGFSRPEKLITIWGWPQPRVVFHVLFTWVAFVTISYNILLMDI
jgi:hypothetical protein